MKLTDEDLKELRKKAEAATPGPWETNWDKVEHDDRWVRTVTPSKVSGCYVEYELYLFQDKEYYEPAAEMTTGTAVYIAAMDPATTIALLDELIRLRCEVWVRSALLSEN